jgi:hypothetical protein
VSEAHPEGSFLADPRLPESEISFAWSKALAVPKALTVLTISVGEDSWILEQDVRHPERWLTVVDPDYRRHWS